MDIKKDPGKFTIRFCMADPRQKRAVEELNAQGRLKAQFLTNAILHYVGIENNGGAPSRAELETIVRSILEKYSTVKPGGWSASRKRGALQCDTGHILNRRKPQYDCGHAESIPQIGSYRPRRRFCMIFCGAFCGYRNPANK